MLLHSRCPLWLTVFAYTVVCCCLFALTHLELTHLLVAHVVAYIAHGSAAVISLTSTAFALRLQTRSLYVRIESLLEYQFCLHVGLIPFLCLPISSCFSVQRSAHFEQSKSSHHQQTQGAAAHSVHFVPSRCICICCVQQDNDSRRTDNCQGCII